MVLCFGVYIGHSLVDYFQQQSLTSFIDNTRSNSELRQNDVKETEAIFETSMLFNSCSLLPPILKCSCNVFYVSLTCELFKYCVSSPCHNGGTCERNDASLTSVSCHCSSGYNGVFCEENLDDCANVKCSNNGTCIDGINYFECDCMDGFSGKYCTKNIDECSSNPCIEGTCEDFINGYKCHCLHGFFGQLCHTELPCFESSQNIVLLSKRFVPLVALYGTIYTFLSFALSDHDTYFLYESVTKSKHIARYNLNVEKSDIMSIASNSVSGQQSLLYFSYSKRLFYGSTKLVLEIDFEHGTKTVFATAEQSVKFLDFAAIGNGLVIETNQVLLVHQLDSMDRIVLNKTSRSRNKVRTASIVKYNMVSCLGSKPSALGFETHLKSTQISFSVLNDPTMDSLQIKDTYIPLNRKSVNNVFCFMLLQKHHLIQLNCNIVLVGGHSYPKL